MSIPSSDSDLNNYIQITPLSITILPNVTPSYSPFLHTRPSITLTYDNYVSYAIISTHFLESRFKLPTAIVTSQILSSSPLLRLPLPHTNVSAHTFAHQWPSRPTALPSNPSSSPPYPVLPVPQEPSPPRSLEPSWGPSDRTPLRPSLPTWSTRSMPTEMGPLISPSSSPWWPGRWRTQTGMGSKNTKKSD